MARITAGRRPPRTRHLEPAEREIDASVAAKPVAPRLTSAS